MEALLIQYGYWILIPLVIIEGPIVILTLSLLSQQIGLSYEFLLLLSFLGDYIGDVAHYLLGRYSKKRISSKKKNKYLIWLQERIEKKSLLDILILIKYIPPLTSVGLIYLGYQKTSLRKFLSLDAGIVGVNSIILVTLGRNYSHLFLQSENISYIIMVTMLGFCVIYFGSKYIRTLLIQNVEHEELPK